MSMDNCLFSAGISVGDGSMDLSGCPGGVVIFFTIFCDIFLIFFVVKGSIFCVTSQKSEEKKRKRRQHGRAVKA